ncbi:hypothetical protein BR1R5_34090 [Pseudomonas sp. BR1R-5]|uniref:helix-turn-helix domain-containing protein n=1 Tax=Pseudomonas sp. BR1R-5 TaxID=3003626 RepID=UPI0022C30857|nr:helix-turn-helix domain-containing protein [Pseudomonas sp. BR1R-5]GLH34021.1 hypothetical protein BR1R5_34090 [Pseudomonas sp. BR1R-5]
MSNGVGERIAQLRGSMKIGDFAECLGVNRKTISRWEAGEALPDGSSLLALHQSFGAAPTWVLLGEATQGEDPPLSAEEGLLLERYRQSPVALREAALRVLLGEKPVTRSFKEVGQYIEGAVNQAGLTLNVGGKRKK